MDPVAVALVAVLLLVLGTGAFVYINYRANVKLETFSERMARLEVENRSLERSLNSANTQAGQQAYQEELTRRDANTQVSREIDELKHTYVSKSLLARTFGSVNARMDVLEERLDSVIAAQMRLSGVPREPKEADTLPAVPPNRAASGVYSSSIQNDKRITVPPPVSYNPRKKD